MPRSITPSLLGRAAVAALALAAHPAAIAAALEAYRLRETHPAADARAELRALDAALDGLKGEERELIAAHLAGMRAGSSPDA